jgi:hypothetical protein
MKSIHIASMERMRSVNLRIGFAAAIAIAILAINWTSELTDETIYEEDLIPSEIEVKTIRTSQATPLTLPASQILRPQDHIIEVPELALTFQPTAMLIDTAFVFSNV